MKDRKRTTARKGSAKNDTTTSPADSGERTYQEKMNEERTYTLAANFEIGRREQFGLSDEQAGQIALDLINEQGSDDEKVINLLVLLFAVRAAAGPLDLIHAVRCRLLPELADAEAVINTRVLRHARRLMEQQ